MVSSCVFCGKGGGLAGRRVRFLVTVTNCVTVIVMVNVVFTGHTGGGSRGCFLKNEALKP